MQLNGFEDLGQLVSSSSIASVNDLVNEIVYPQKSISVSKQ